MGIIVIAFLLSIVQFTTGQDVCSDAKSRIQDCFKTNGLYNTMEGKGLVKLGDLCYNKRIQSTSNCLVSAINDCKLEEYYDMDKLRTASEKLCKSDSTMADNCDVYGSGIANCITEKGTMLDRKKDGMDAMEAMCQMNGGIKKCIGLYLEGSCNTAEKYRYLMEVFTKKKCMAYDDCSVCYYMQSASSTIVASLTFITVAVSLFMIF